MSCRESERWLDTFFDGELEGRVMRDAALHVTRCQDCASALRAHEHLQGLLQETIRGELDEIAARPEAGSFWAGIEAGIDAGTNTGIDAGIDAAVDASAGGHSDLAMAGSAGARPARRSSDDSGRRRAGSQRPNWLARRSPRRASGLGRANVRRAITGLALAASAVFAVYASFEGSGWRGSVGFDRVAGAPDPVLRRAGGQEASVARIAARGAGGAAARTGATGATGEIDARLGQAPLDVAAAGNPRAGRRGRDDGLRLASESSIGLAEPSPARSNQIQIESMDYSGRSLAMWSEPGSETTVIWVDDDAQGPAAAPGVALIPVAPGGAGRSATTRAVASHVERADQLEFPR